MGEKGRKRGRDGRIRAMLGKCMLGEERLSERLGNVFVLWILQSKNTFRLMGNCQLALGVSVTVNGG